MTITTKEDFLNIRIDDKTIRDYLDLIAEEESIEEKLHITNKILQKLKENKPYVTVSAKELLDKIVNLHNAITEINSFSDYWKNETDKPKSVKDYMLFN